MIQHNLNPIIFIIYNNIYTIECFIHGMEAGYNDIQNWRYKDLVTAFEAEEGSYKTYEVKTKDDVNALLQEEKFSKAPYLQFVEWYMPWDNSPAGCKFEALPEPRFGPKLTGSVSLCNGTGQRPQQCQDTGDMIEYRW